MKQLIKDNQEILVIVAVVAFLAIGIIGSWDYAGIKPIASIFTR